MTFSYRPLIDKAVLNIFKDILKDIIINGLAGDQSFYISFFTSFDGVVLSKAMKEKYPKEITIVLQHQFSQLKVQEEKFMVTISFSGKTERIEVPFNSITSFLDPVAGFGFQFSVKENQEKKDDRLKISQDINTDLPREEAGILHSNIKFSTKNKKTPLKKEAEIISLQSFKKKHNKEKHT